MHKVLLPRLAAAAAVLSLSLLGDPAGALAAPPPDPPPPPWPEVLDLLGDPSLPPPVRATCARLDGWRFEVLHRPDVALTALLEELGRAAGVRFTVEPGARHVVDGARASLLLREVPARAVLDEALGDTGLGWRVEPDDGAVLVGAPAPAGLRALPAVSGGELLRRRLSGLSSRPAPVAIEALATAAGVSFELDDEVRACADLVELPSGCDLEEACERLALATGGEWSLRQGPDGRRLLFTLSDAGARAGLRAALARWPDRAAEEAARRAEALRAPPRGPGADVATMRARREEARGALLLAFHAVLRAAAAQDVSATRDGEAVALERQRAWADLAAWLTVLTRRWSGDCCRLDPPPEPRYDANTCACRFARLAVRITHYLAAPALRAADHPGRFIAPR